MGVTSVPARGLLFMLTWRGFEQSDGAAPFHRGIMQGRQGYRDAAPCKSTRKRKPGNNANAHGSALPPESFHIHAPVGFELDAFPFQQVLLFGPIGGGAAGVVDYAVFCLCRATLHNSQAPLHRLRHTICAAKRLGNTQSITCVFCLTVGMARSPYRHLGQHRTIPA